MFILSDLLSPEFKKRSVKLNFANVYLEIRGYEIKIKFNYIEGHAGFDQFGS